MILQDRHHSVKRKRMKQFGGKLLLLFILLFFLINCKKKEETKIEIKVPVLTTLAPSDITATFAAVGGNISSDGGGSIIQKGVCYGINPDPGISDSVVYNHDDNNNYTCNLSGLDPNTPYFARAFAINNAGISYGNQVTFTTLKKVSLPTVITFPITGITQDSAISGGDVTNDGGAAVTARGVCWSISLFPTISDHHTTDGGDTGSFTSEITGLSMKTAYYVRAYATNSVGTSYGNEVSFITADTSSGQPCPGLSSITYEGKIYHTILIGTQCWLKENLNVGTRINGVQNQDPANGRIDKYCYNDLEIYCDTYGGLYQWDEMMQGSSTSGVQGICPQGWHLPVNSEWDLLILNLGGEDVAGGKMKSNTGWFNDGNSPNSSGFTAVPGGLRYYDGRFGFFSYFGYFWSSEYRNSTDAWYRNLSYDNTIVYQNFDKKILGYSVRCIKD